MGSKRLTRKQARNIDFLVLGLEAASGVLHPHPHAFYETALRSIALLSVMLYGGGVVMMALGHFFGRKIQKASYRWNDIKREAFETLLAIIGFSCLQAWPLTFYRLGEPCGLYDSLEDVLSVWNSTFSKVLGFPVSVPPGAFVVGYIISLVLLADMYTYFKHRLLHTPTFFAFHCVHHTFKNPTCFAGFGVAPVEAFLTFWPITLVSFPSLAVWAPLQYLVFTLFYIENLYLHCGSEIWLFEKTWSLFFVNTSKFHNYHHEKTVTHFGEVLTLWDCLLGTSDWYTSGKAKGKANRGPTVEETH